MRINEVDNPVTQADIDQLEVFADRLFAKVGIDVEFTRHFLDRVNDERNIKQITMSELTRLFKQEYKRWGKPIARLGPDAEAVMKDMATDINLPFALRWDHKNNELDLIAKTVMRKANFKTSNQEFAVEDGYKSMFRPSAYEMAAERLHSVLQRKEKENGGVFRHALGWYAARIASGFRDIDSRELVSYYQKHFDPVLSEADLSYAPTMLMEQALPNMWPSNPQQFQSKLGTLPGPANQVRGNIIELFPEQFKNNPRIRVSVGNYLVKNPAIFQELVAANDNNASRFKLPGWVKKAAPFAKVFGGILTGILWPTPAGDPNEAQSVILYNMIDSIIRTDPSTAMEDIKEWYKDQGKAEDYVDDWYYQNAVRHHNDQIVKQLDGVVDPGLQRAANELADRMRKAENQKALDDLIGTIDGPLQNAINNLAPNVITELPPEALLNPETNAEDLGLNPPPSEFNDPTEIFDIPPLVDPAKENPPLEIFPPEANPEIVPPLEIDTTSPPEIEIPDFDPEVDIPDIEPKTNPKVDPTVPKRITQPSREEPFRQPEPPVDPTVDPEYTPSQPKIPTEPDVPEVPDSKPSDQPDIEIPQPLNAPQKEIPFIPPANVTDPEIAFQNNPAKDIPAPVSAAPPTNGRGNNNNNNKKNRKRRKWDSGGSSDSDYTDPLQRWQRKYGMWDQ